MQLLMETDVEGLIGAGRHERTAERATYRNGYRDRTLDTRLGSLQLRIPKLQQGSYFPLFLDPRETSKKRRSPSSRRPGSVVSRPEVSTTWSRQWVGLVRRLDATVMILI